MSTTFTDFGHAEKILLKLWKQCESKEFCDTVLVAGTEAKRIPAHRSVLSAASEYFDELFASSARLSLSREVEMSNINGDILQCLVKYCYTGCIVIREEYVIELFKTAHKLLLRNVVTACENFLVEQLHPSNCFGLVLLAERYHFKMLLNRARDYSLENFLKVRESPAFLRLSAEKLSQLLASDDLCVTSEEDVFNSLMRWIEHDRNERVKHLAELLKLVRMPLLERSFLMKHVKPICASTECLKIYTNAIERHLSQDSATLSESELAIPRRSHQFLMAISLEKSDKKMFIHHYCPQRNAWMKWLKDLKYRRAFGVAVIKNHIFIIGGFDASGNILNSAIRLNLRTMSLEQMTSLNEHRAGCRAAALKGFLYVMGGWNGEQPLSSIEKWNPETHKWDVVSSMSTSRYDFGIAVLHEKLYAVGGVSFSKVLDSAECYDPIQKERQYEKFIKSMNGSRHSPGIAVANEILYAVGDYYGNKKVERYDPETNQWTPMCSIREKLLTSQCCTSFRDKVVVCYKDRIEEFDAAANEWKEIMSLKQPDNIYGIYSYSDKLLTSKFVKNSCLSCNLF